MSGATSLANSFLFVALACFGFTAQASILTFEDLPTGGPAFFLADYQGFRFGTNNIVTTAWFYTDEVTPFYTPKSPTHFIATDFNLYSGGAFEATQAITSTTDFTFDGAYFTGVGQIYYELYNNNVLVHTSAESATLADASPLFVGSGYAGLVDEVVVRGKQGFYALDDFTYNTPSNSVPEPSGLALFTLAALVAAGASRRRKKAA